MLNKKLFVAVAVSLLIVCYAYFTKTKSILESHQHRAVLKNRNLNKTKVVILLTMMRSGSSILGSIFNERVNVTYLYESLFPFGKQACDETTRKSSLAVLRNVSNCQFENLRYLYQNSTRDDTYAR